jgi:phospholipid/cholesterol/gamma-HCH transport system ATP-binding protein
MSSAKTTSMIEVVDFHKSFADKKVHQGVLLRSLIGLEKADQGKIFIQGTEISRMNEQGLVDIRRKVAYAFQGGALFDSMTVFENLAYPLREHTKLSEAEIKTRILNQLSEFGLDKSEYLYPGSLSGGMQKRVGLARAMMMQPEVVLYDEPTAGLDPYNTKRIQESILKLKAKGVTSILVTHDMPTVYAVCDKVALLVKGKIEEQYTIEKLRQEPSGMMTQFINGESA